MSSVEKLRRVLAYLCRRLYAVVAICVPALYRPGPAKTVRQIDKLKEIKKQTKAACSEREREHYMH